MLAWTDFAPLCSQIGWDQNTAHQLWWMTDTDRSGTLSRTEFLAFAARPDVKPYLTAYENKVCPPAGAIQTAASALPGDRLFRSLEQKGTIRGGMLAWTDFAPLCSQIG